MANAPSPGLTEAETAALAKCKFHHKFAELFEPHEYKVAYGGRAGLKSWHCARTLLVLGTWTKMRILCGREIQKTLKDSVHQLLTDQIEMLGLSEFYDVLEGEIRGRNGTLFLFSGLSSLTVESVKSFEGVDVLWLEEARNISKRSFEIIIPTIRKEHSEIWMSFNPELDSDEVYARFVLAPPKDTIKIFTTYHDNPWASQRTLNDAEHCKLTDPEGYKNIWLGQCRPTVAGAIYTKEIALAYAEQRICRVICDPNLKVHTVWDLGHEDYMSIGLYQRGRTEWRMIGLIHEHHKKLDWYAAELNNLNLNWGWDWLPHDGFIQDYKAPSAYTILKSFGRRVKPKINTKLPIPNVDIETGIKAFRMVWPRMIIDEVKCKPFIEAAKRYRRSINKETQMPGPPVHDPSISDLMDMGRYFALIHDKMTNDEELSMRPKAQIARPFDAGTGLL